jgi:hypothetical protein
VRREKFAPLGANPAGSLELIGVGAEWLAMVVI